jgi:hypothetical protein
LRTHFIGCLDTPRIPNVRLVSRKNKVIDEVVIEFGEKDRMGCVCCIGLQVHVGMRDDGLLECIKCNNPASAVIEGISGLSKIRTPTDKTKLGKACLYVFEHVFLNEKNLTRNLSTTLQ